MSWSRAAPTLLPPLGTVGAQGWQPGGRGGGDSAGASPQPVWINLHGRVWWFVCQKYLISASVTGEERAHPALREIDTSAVVNIPGNRWGM